MGCTQSIRSLYNNRYKVKMAAGKNNPDLKSPEKERMEKNAVKAELKSFGQIDRYMCDICGQEGLSDVDMKSHVLLEHVENQVSCPFCDLEGTTLEDMTLHVNSQHLDLLTPSREDFEVGAFEQLTSARASDDGGGVTEESVRQDNSGGVSNPDKPTSTITSSISKSSAGNVLTDQNPSIKTCDTDTTPKRARLHLEVPAITVQKPRSGANPESRKESRAPQMQSSPPNYSCPLCGWSTSESGEITQHVNVAHLDAMTPTKIVPTDSSDCINNNVSQSPLECPMCSWVTCDSAELERHVGIVHSDDLFSPDVISMDSLGSPLLSCPVCGMECTDNISLHRHVEGHFSGNQTPGSDQEMYDCVLAQELQQVEILEMKQQEKKDTEQDQHELPVNSNFKKQLEKDMEQAVSKGQMSVADYYIRKQELITANTTGIDDGHSCTKGIIEALHKYYKTGPVGVSKYWLCSSVDHYASSFGDKGWGCGYRNLQMLLSSLAKCDVYEQVLFNGRPLIPSISKIQRLIETAWQKGFDRAGCEQLGGKVINTTKWIGATEIVATLSSLKIKCQLVDFHTPTGANSTHPRLFEWVKSYFKNVDKFKPPLYLQHQGHSRTIIGLEQTKDGSLRLLLFDPSCRKPQMIQFLQDISPNLMRTLRRPVHTLKAKQYQIVSVQGILTENEYQESKMLKSEQIP